MKKTLEMLYPQGTYSEKNTQRVDIEIHDDEVDIYGSYPDENITVSREMAISIAKSILEMLNAN